MYVQRLTIIIAAAVAAVLQLSVNAVALTSANTTNLMNSNNTNNNNSSSGLSMLASASASTSTLTPLTLATAEKLVRLRRQPFTIIKHISRASHKRSKPRRRYKRPKVHYGPPSYSYGRPLTYYKPRKPPKISVEEIHHLNVDTAEYELPPSSYESQVMDLDFYSHGGYGDGAVEVHEELPDSKYHPAIEVEEPTYTYDAPTKHSSGGYGEGGGGGGYGGGGGGSGGGGYAQYETPAKHSSGGEGDSYAAHVPHQSYGVPKDHEYATDFHSDYSSSSHYTPPVEQSKGHEYSYSSGSSYESVSYDTKKEYEHRPDAEPHSPPSSGYGASASDHGSYALPSPPSPDSYSVYEKKIPNSGYATKQNFAEPPYEHKGGGADIEITYSPPSYEINLPPTQPGANHPDESGDGGGGGGGGGHFAEPPAHSAPAQEAPIYHAPPPQQQPPPHPHPPPPQHPPKPPQHHPGSIQDYLPPKQELPLNVHHKQPTYDYPKSSYEVPIYDPIPFDATTTVDQRELYPPHPYDILRQSPPDVGNEGAHSETVENKHIEPSYNSNESLSTENGLHDDRRAAGSSLSPATEKPVKRKRRQRKRKRVQGSTTITATSTTKHILDTPELDAAFRAGHSPPHAQYHDHDHDVDGHESSFVEETQTTVRGPTRLPYPALHDHYASQAWNPMRLRTPSSTPIPTTTRSITVHSVNTTAAGAAAAATTTAIRKRPFQRPRPIRLNAGDAATAATPILAKPHNNKSVTIVTIEKSRSQNYYDGTTAPPAYTNTPNVQRTRPTRVRMPTRPAQIVSQAPANKAAAAAAPSATATTNKRTTKSVFETTYFKTPNYDRELQKKLSSYELNLPKNHRPY